MYSLRKALRRIFDIRYGEWFRVLLMFSYLFLLIACYITTKSVRDAMFLTEIGVKQLPYVFILIALVVGSISSAYSRAAARVSLKTLIRTTSLIAISNLFLFWLTLDGSGCWQTMFSMRAKRSDFLLWSEPVACWGEPWEEALPVSGLTGLAHQICCFGVWGSWLSPFLFLSL